MGRGDIAASQEPLDNLVPLFSGQLCVDPYANTIAQIVDGLVDNARLYAGQCFWQTLLRRNECAFSTFWRLQVALKENLSLQELHTIFAEQLRVVCALLLHNRIELVG